MDVIRPLDFHTLGTGVLGLERTTIDDSAIGVTVVLCAGTVQAGSPFISFGRSYRTIAICKRVDASNFACQLPDSSIYTWQEIEIIPDGGSITVFGIFFDGSTSFSSSTGMKF